MKKKIIIPKLKIVEPSEKNIRYYINNFVHIVIYSVCAFIIGAIIGAFDAVFMKVIVFVTNIREQYPFYFIPLLFLSGILIYFMFDHFGKNNPVSLYLEQDKRAKVKLRLIPIVILATWLTHLFGGCAGTESAAIQIGGTLGILISQKLSIKSKDTTGIITAAGLSAAFGGLFGTPVTAIFFALEVLSSGYIEVAALIPTMVAAYTSIFVSQLIGIERFVFNLEVNPDINAVFIVILVLASVFFGIIGGLFAFIFKKIKKFLTEIIPGAYIRTAFIGIIISVISLCMYTGRYSGTGSVVINSSLDGNVYYWDFIMIFIMSILTLSVGYQGGVFIPLFAIGSSFGAVTAMIFNMPVALFAALGYAAVFGAATGTLFAPIFLGAEIFGYEYMPYFFVVCVIAYIFHGDNSIYKKGINRHQFPQLLLVKK